MGREGLFEGIMLLTGKDELRRYIEMQECPIPDIFGINYQEGILMVYNTRDYMLEDNMEVVDEFMKRQYKGKVISFESFTRGYMPSSLSEEELDDALVAFKTFERALRDMDKTEKEDKSSDEYKDFKKFKASFKDHNDRCMHITFDEDDDELTFEVCDKPNLASTFKTVSLPEGFDNLDDAARLDDVYEVEFLNFVPIPAKKVKYKTALMNEAVDKTNLVRYFALVNETTEKVIEFKTVDAPFMGERDNEDYLGFVFPMLIELMNENGVPKKLLVRDDESVALLSDLADKAGITLIKSPELKIIDDFVTGFYEHVLGPYEDIDNGFDINNDDDDDEEGEDEVE
ncbi:MAG: hypothetical protein MJ246_08735 [Clostridia bacterium]|nr:hypothetical protein [Clostridia bacterium]